MSHEPRCPKCHTTVQPSWDWCQGCGYDPASRKPDGWTPASAVPVAATTSPPPVPAPVRGPGPDIDLSTPAAAEPARRDPAGPWRAPAPPGAGRVVGDGATRVTTLVGPGAARPQEMRDPDWVQAPGHRKLPIPALIGLLVVVAAAIGALLVVTLMVLHRPIGTTGGGALDSQPSISWPTTG